MIKISQLQKIADNLEALGYMCEKTSLLYVYRKGNNRFDVDLELRELRMYVNQKFKQTFSFTAFIQFSNAWLHKKQSVDSWVNSGGGE